MDKFSKYFLMEEQDALDYVKYKYSFFDENAVLTCKEIGDGNLNYVFRIKDENTGKSIILKHSGSETRAKSGRIIDTDRARIEAEILQHQNKLAPNMVPEVYGYDPIMCCTAMEDCKDYTIMRTALLEGKTFPFFPEQVTSYLVNILLPTSDIAMNHKDKKRKVKSYINPDLCNITEQLVFSEPAGNFSGKNYETEGSAEFVEKEIYSDLVLRKEIAKLKFHFMECAQALLHGDIHSGSIFINDENMKAFDVEFAFYGPMGYDLGNVLAHLIFALGYNNYKKNETFRIWCLSALKDIVNLFKVKFLKKYEECVTDDLAKTQGFDQCYLDSVIEDTIAFMGTELIRRVVGVAKVKDITNLPDDGTRTLCEKKLLSLGKKAIINKAAIYNGEKLVTLVKEYF
ncbi:MAG: S-methyl-5-thioribose kinase [Sphaerochaetaceae bacterium]|nr:S-methyl-5-thioribose kinase [Sphaerochaetaceae bacterium]